MMFYPLSTWPRLAFANEARRLNEKFHTDRNKALFCVARHKPATDKSGNRPIKRAGRDAEPY